MVWSIAIANILGAGICSYSPTSWPRSPWCASASWRRWCLAITFICAFEATRQWGDIGALLLIGLIGWMMKRLGWPRPPLILGFVLGELVERYMFISVSRYGFEWLERPVVQVMVVITVLGLAVPVFRKWRTRVRGGLPRRHFGFSPVSNWPDVIFSVIMAALFAGSLFISSSWD